ncbi:MAG: metalloregulator ArsR/SmtB family transcription factor [Deltaproteobacteria bacterium]|nr:metalloregulator ArsR/SmtB family transcription factor [Deltaproteobacteria bacterium]
MEATARLFKALAHPGRLQVLLLLAEEEPRSAGDLARATGLEQTALSHQLSELRKARLVEAQREGRQRLYRLADHHVAHIVKDALAHAGEEHD